MKMSSAKNFEIEIDSDAQETREWIDALQSVIKAGIIVRARFLLSRLSESARQLNVQWRDFRNTSYVNTILVQDEPAFPCGTDALETGNAGFAQMKVVAERAAQQKSGLLTLALTQFMSPIPQPDRNIYCVGWNYLDHFEEGKKARGDTVVEKIPDHPVFFSKATHTMNGLFDPIPHDATNSNTTDWEAELAVVIGQRGRNIPEDKAMDYVFGYAAYNDTTSREIQQKRQGGQWFKGKSLDDHCPMAPWIVTAAGVTLDDAHVICRVHGVEKQNGSYKQIYFKIPRIIAELSRGLTLEPGDIIATGMPSGVGFARKPPKFLKPGDAVETEIAGVGIIRNPIRSEIRTTTLTTAPARPGVVFLSIQH